jgi:hypothetical protein
MLRRHLTRTRLGLVLAVGVGVLLGAVFGQPGAGRAASDVTKPVNTVKPVVTGTPEVGLKLTATRGTWTQKPTSFKYVWSRCDSDGACLTISGATGKTYTVSTADVGHELVVTVTAHNSAGDTPQASLASTTVPPSGCPVGSAAIAITQLAPPAQLVIAGASASPAVTRSARAIHLQVLITACGGRPVVGASVVATAIPYNQFADASGTTTANGTVVLSGARRAGFPASPHQRLLAVFVRAAPPGASPLGGVSARRVLAFRLGHH